MSEAVGRQVRHSVENGDLVIIDVVALALVFRLNLQGETARTRRVNRWDV